MSKHRYAGWIGRLEKIRKITKPKTAVRRDAVTPSFSVRGQPEGQALRLSTVAVFDSLCPCGYEQRKCPCLYERWKGFFLLGGSRWASNEKRTNLGRRKKKSGTEENG